MSSGYELHVPSITGNAAATADGILKRVKGEM